MTKQVSRRVGKGITEREQTQVELNFEGNEGDLAKADFFQRWMALDEAARTREWGTHASHIAAIRAEIYDMRSPLTGLTPGTDEYLTVSRELAARFVERETEEWFFLEIARFATIAELALQQGRLWEAVDSGIKIGELFAELRIAFDWNADAMRGRSNQGHLRAHQANRRRGSRKSRFEAMEAEIARKPGQGRAARALAATFRIEPETLEKEYRLEKKMRTSARNAGDDSDT